MPINPAPPAPTVRTPRTATPKTPTKVVSKTDQRIDGLSGLIQIGQLGLVMTGQYADAGAIGHFTPPIIRETVKLAESHEGIAKGIDVLCAAGPYTALVGAALPLVLQLMANHKRLNAAQLGQFGVVSPEVLDARMKADIMRQQADALRMQREAEQQLREAMEELNEQGAE